MQGTMMQAPLTLPSLLERASRLFGRREVVSRRSDRSIHRYTYADLRRRAAALAEALQSAGLAPGDRVATLMWNDFAHLEAYFGVPLAGGVLHTLNLRLPPAQLAWIANDASDRFLIVDETLLPLLEKWRGQTRLERVFVVRVEHGHGAPPLPVGYECYEAFIAGPGGTFQPPAYAESDACGLCYTSGTEGNPKGVLYTHRSSVLHSLVLALPDTLDISRHDTILPVVPMFHVNAWGIPYSAVMSGSKLVLPGRFLDAESLLELFEREQVTLTAGVPSIWIGLLQALDREPTRWKLPRMRMIIGGSAAPESLIRGFDRHGQQVIHAWGMTETSPVGALSNLKPEMMQLSEDERYAYRAKQGLPPPLVELRIMAENGPAKQDGTALGELQARGPWVAGSYFGASHDPDRFTADGWLRTGDIATIDPEGYVKIVDRTKDLIKSGGEWISSCEVENALMSHPAVLEACVIAVPSTEWGERPLALVVFRPGAQASSEQLSRHIAPSFPKWWLPDGFVSVKEIAKTSVGKFAKSTLREQYAAWKPTDPVVP
jgi:fatty-acyl-CoA synthase